MDSSLASLAQQCEGAHTDKQGWRARCPVHNGKGDDSLHLWEEAGTIRVHCFAGCDAKSIMDRLGLAPSREGPLPQAIYSYQDAKGYTLFQVVRLQAGGGKKTFRQRRPDIAHPGKWLWNMDGVPDVLYHLPEVEQAITLRHIVYLVEGEKDVETLRNLGLIATCNRGGAGKWSDAYTEQLKNADIVLIPDNDTPGKAHADLIMSRLRGTVRSLTRLELSDVPSGGDVTDWFQLGHSREALQALHTKIDPAITSPHLVLVKFSDVEPEEIEWLWHPYLPLGKLTILEGDPGQGKTYLMLAIAAAMTRGYVLPDQRGRPGPPGNAIQNVIYISAEDGLADTLVPRAIRADANREHLYGVRGVSSGGEPQPFSLAQVTLLSDAIRDTQAKLIIIDPIQAFLGAEVDMHRANEVRPLMASLSRIAELHKCAILIIRHINKGNGKALYRGMGSIDFTAAARSVLVVAESLEDPSKKILAQAKNSLDKNGASLAFAITDDGFHWCGVSRMGAEELLSQQPVKGQHQQNAAMEWLVETLRNGEMLADAIMEEAEANGIKERTLRTVKARLGVLSYQRDKRWYWRLPDEEFDSTSSDEDDIPNF